MDRKAASADIIEVGRRMYQRALVAANDGNISVKLEEDRILITPTGVSKGFMTEDMLIVVDYDGKVVEGNRKPSTEVFMHTAVYRHRPDVGAVVHAHPPAATAFATAGKAMDKYVLPELVISLGKVPLAPYAMPGTQELPDSIVPFLADHDSVLMANHGVLVVGTDVMTAYFRLESLEHVANIIINAERLGGARELPPERVQQLVDSRPRYGVKGRHPERSN